MQADATTRLMVLVIAGGVFFEAMSAPSEWFRSQVLARPIFVAGLFGLGIASSLRIAFVLLGKPVAWFAWPVLIDAAITAALVLAFYRRGDGPPLAQWRPNVRRMRDLLRRSWPLAVAAGLGVTQQRIDQVMLGQMLDSTEVGWYAAAARLSQLWYFVPMALATAVFPATVRARETSRELYYRRMQAFFNLMLWLAIAISLPAALVAEPVIHVLYGDAYARSADVLQIHIWSLVLTSLGIATGNWMIAEGLTGAILGFSIVSVSVNILLNLLLIPSYGAVGAAWATLAGWGTVLLLKFCYGPTRPAALMMLKSLATPIRPLMWRSWSFGRQP
jgi:polysaccharide transporter, PST family